MAKYVSEKEAYENLANAIIISAAIDYKKALIRQKKHPDNKGIAADVRRLESFFYSDWYEVLTDLDPGYLIRKMQDTIDEKYGEK